MSDPALDPGTIDRLRALNQPGEADLVAEVLTLFRESAPGRIAAIESALERHDPSALQRAAHEFKGATGTIGALGLQRTCRELEMTGKRGTLDGAGAIVHALKAEYARVEQEIDRLVGPGR